MIDAKRELVIHYVGGECVVSDASGWLPGVFDTIETVRACYSLMTADEVESELADIYQASDVDDNGRAVTFEDIAAARGREAATSARGGYAICRGGVWVVRV